MGFFKSLGAGLGVLANPMIAGGLLTAGGDIASAFAEHQAQKDANAANQLQAREQMQFSAAQAQRQMEFQERMSNTSHQREVADLQKAGLNPLLSVNSGASTPGGASGSVAGYTAEALPPVISRVMASALEKARYNNELRTMLASTRQMDAASKAVKSDAELKRMEVEFARKDPDAYFAARLGPTDVLGGRVYSGVMSSAKQANKIYEGKLGVMKQTPFAPVIDLLVERMVNSALQRRKNKNKSH